MQNNFNQNKKDTEIILRPSNFNHFTGQKKTIERLQVMVGASLKRGDALNHILLSGPPGLGKTTLAHILGITMKSKLCITSGPMIKKPGDLAGLLTNLMKGDILFIDEIHRISRTVEEYLYSAMEDYKIDIMIDQGPNARSISLSIENFTLIGATTRTGLLTAALRSRFALQTRLNYYSQKDICKIVVRSCKLLETPIDEGGAIAIASRARGTPRIANNLVHFARDYSQQYGSKKITEELAIASLELLEIDVNGLDEMDKNILQIIGKNYNGGPVGLNTISIAVGEESHTLEEVHEPYLIQEGLIKRTPQGRVLTKKGWKIAGIKLKKNIIIQNNLI